MTGAGLFLLFLLSLMFPITWKVLFAITFKVIFPVLKWAIVIGAIIGFTCSDQFYHAFGWSPLSIIIGPSIHNKQPRNQTDAAKDTGTKSGNAKHRPVSI